MLQLAQTIRLHREGLLRVGRIIDANPNYDELLEYRLTGPEWASFTPRNSLERKRQQATSMFESKFRARRHQMILPEFPGIACDGKTHNNLREFQFFERICAPAGIRISDRNYGQCQTVSISKLQPEEAAAHEAITADVAAYYQERSDIAASLVRQQILYSRSFFTFLLSFSRPGAVLPSALVQANDHSPASVALSMVFKGMGVPRIYLQHAEVTPNFPALDFEYSVLRNQQSQQTYASVAPPAGQVYVIPRYEEPFARDRLSQERGTDVRVVLYPTSRVLLDELRAIVGALNDNPAVGRVMIKQHPGAAKRLDHALEGLAVELVDELPTEDHVAIVGNSSVAIELLHRGVPVYQNFAFDPVSRDYYGLVAGGVTREVTTRNLTGKFWRTYAITSDWLDRYVRLDPTASTDYQAEQAAFVAEMQRLAARDNAPVTPPKRMKGRIRARLKAMGKRGALRAIDINKPLATRGANLILAVSHRLGTFLTVNSYYAASFLQTRLKMNIKAPVWSGAPRARTGASRAELIGFLEQTLADLENPAEWIMRNDAIKVFDGETIISTVEAMFQNRRPALNTVFGGYPQWPAGSAVGTWIYLKKSEWGNIPLLTEELAAISGFVYAYDGDTLVRALLESSLLKAILRGGTGEQLDGFWRNASVVRKEGLGLNTRMALQRKLRSLPGREAEAERALEEIKANSTPLELLKLDNMAFMEGRPARGWNHAHAEQQFAHLAPSRIAREFAANIQPAYDILRSRMPFMDVRSSRAEADELIRRIRASIEDRKPFSLIRLSDGEGYLFPEGQHFTASDAANRERHWWGTELAAELREKIVHEARNAVSHADVVGIPAIYRFIRDFGDNSLSLTETVQGRGLLQVLGGVAALAAPDARFAEDKVNVSLFSRHDDLLSLAEAAGKLIIIGSVNRGHLPSSLTQAQRTTVILLPTHARTALNDRYNPGTEPLPLAYPSLLKKLEALVTPGDLVLVAGGIVGKILVGRARKKGAVALDIGSVIDDWVNNEPTTLR